MSRATDPEELFAAALEGDRGAIARMLSLVERGGEPARQVGRMAYSRSGSAYTVGMTGAPGAGKSTLTSALIGHMRSLDIEVAVLAIDPSSPFTGGAILGDRVRMQDHATDPGVFIRSMATRGHLGGLALATPEAVRVLDAIGFEWVVVETVGVGQVEVDVAGAADTTVVVVNPGWGDAVQAAKAGLLEIADVFVVNKADRPGAADAERDLTSVLGMAGGRDTTWTPPVLRTVATTGDGVDALLDAITTHRAHLESSGGLEARRAARVEAELRAILVARVLEQVGAAEGDDRFAKRAAAVLARDVDPWTATDDLL